MKIFLPIWILLFASFSFGLPEGWQQIRPGGETLCARGAEYSFLVRHGDPQKIVVDFAGGGACWSPMTCDSEQMFTDTVRESISKVEAQAGIYDHNNPANPYRGWTHVYIPYCTGDLHLGSRDTNYQRFNNEVFTIHHRGAVNVKAVMEWLRLNYGQPAEVSLAGCSAGSYASIVWTAYVAEAYKSAKIFQFGDSGAGVSNQLFFPQWGMQVAFPSWIPKLNPNTVDWSRLTLSDVYRSVAEYYPRIQLSQLQTEKDRVQTFLYVVLGGMASNWKAGMLTNMETAAMNPNFHYFVAPGKEHCSAGRDLFYSTRSDGVSLPGWVSNALRRSSFENVKCLECGTAEE